MMAMAAPLLVSGGCGSKEQRELFFQKHFKELSGDELKETLTKLEADYKRRMGVDISISTKKEIFTNDLACETILY